MNFRLGSQWRVHQFLYWSHVSLCLLASFAPFGYLIFHGLLFKLKYLYLQHFSQKFHLICNRFEGKLYHQFPSLSLWHISQFCKFFTTFILERQGLREELSLMFSHICVKKWSYSLFLSLSFLFYILLCRLLGWFLPIPGLKIRDLNCGFGHKCSNGRKSVFFVGNA